MLPDAGEPEEVGTNMGGKNSDHGSETHSLPGTSTWASCKQQLTFRSSVLTSAPDACVCIAFEKKLSRWRVISSCFSEPDSLSPAPCLHIRLSFTSLSPPHRKHNFPLSLSFPYC